ncbi:UDP-N-acetylmuramate dehydrogenase [Runella sp.]|jgi:UDP-N-acetylmuramate dehydrogenase|uniref:UDP-N-acetylmuramate dehydrogenase n=1 Tax=Runella sp. TaxID=1960881 RepID=UPI0026121FFD|nr:UDP-N-acetylmuramate dehydrogenase [Runella sp.]
MLTIQSNVSLKSYNTFGIDVSTRYLVEVDNDQDIQTLFQLPDIQSLPKLILGGGSNLLLTQDFNGLVIKINIKGIETVKEDQNHVWLRVGAGENWHEFVMYCVERGLGGIENLSLIPGTVGAAPMQNIGAYGVEIKDTFDRLEAVDISTGIKRVFTNADCRFGYRDSVFKNEVKGQYIISNVQFRLDKNPVLHLSYGDIQKTLEQMSVKELTIKAISEAVIKIRRSKLPDPAEIGNAGSFFKNPEIPASQYEILKSEYPDIPGYVINEEIVKVPAGWLIEQCGWKGKRFGTIGVHTRQALVLVNYSGGKGLEIKQLSEKIQASVEERFGIYLHTEVNFV